MRLNSHDEIENILINNLKKGSGIPEFIRDLQDSGIRDEHYKARRVAVTEVLCAHSVAQQEAFMQSPAVKEKKWRHTGSYRNEPRKNHESMNGQIVPVEKFCHNCGAKEFITERINKINFIDINYAVLVKTIIPNEHFEYTQSWAESKETSNYTHKLLQQFR